MANLINRGMGNMPPSMPAQQGKGVGMPDLKGMLQNPQVKEQIRNVYRAYNGDASAFLQSIIQNNPKLRNNYMLNTIMQSRNNPNGILDVFGLTQEDFANIVNG